MKGLVLIPAYQAEKHLGSVLKNVLIAFSKSGDVLVVDDGSSDGTARIAQKYGVFIISHRKNCGKGAALKSGFRFAIEKGYDYVICLDADGQHDPLYIPSFRRMFESGGFDLILGTRKLSPGHMPYDRYLSNRLSSVVASIAAGKRIHDSQSGYRLLSKNLIGKLRLRTQQYETETEILLQAVRNFNVKTGELPITVSYGREESHINRLTDTIRFLRVVLKSIGSN